MIKGVIKRITGRITGRHREQKNNRAGDSIKALNDATPYRFIVLRRW